MIRHSELAEEHYARLLRHLFDARAFSDSPAAIRVCDGCGAPFDVPRGLARFAKATATPLPSRCPRCRPTRRQAQEGRAW